MFDIKILKKRHSCNMQHAPCHQNGNTGNHFIPLFILRKENVPKEKNEFIQKITFMSRLLKCLEKRKRWNFIHDYYHCYYACISSFRHQHYHQMTIAIISKLFCFSFLGASWALKCLDFRFWAWLTSILEAIYCRSMFLHWTFWL